MRRILRFPLQSFVAVVTLLALSLPAAPMFAQTGSSTAQITVDVPASGAQVANGSRVLIGGWAVDSAGPGTGVDQVQVYLDGERATGTLLGTATSGGNRPDVAQALGNPAFDKSGFDFFWTPTNVRNGNHTLYIYAHSITSNAWSYKTVTVNVTGGPPERGDYGPGRMGYGGRMHHGMMDEIGMPYPHDLHRRHHTRACILIFPPPPGCGVPVPPPPPPPPPPFFPPQQSMLPAPTSVLPVANSPTSITLIWSPVPGAASYRVLRITGTGTVPVPVVSVTPVSATVTGLTPGSTNTFVVAAVDPLGQQGTLSTPVTVTTPL